MKKKIISLVLILCIMAISVLFTSCGKRVFNAMDVEKALEKTRNLDSMSVEMNTEMNMSMEGMTMDIPLTAEINAKGLKSDSPIVSSVITMTILGQSAEIEMYQEGEWAYMVADGMEYKTNVENVESEYDYSDDVNNILQDIPVELLKDVEFINGEDGSVSFSVSIPDEQFSDIYDDFIDSVGENSDIEGDEMKISDAVVKVTVADGYISVYDIEFTMELTVEGMLATIGVNASVTYKDPGEEVEVTPPEGYRDFEEMNLDSII